MSTYQPDLSTRQIEQIGRRLAADRRKAVDSIQDDVCPATGLYARYGKRCLDIGLSAVALVVTFPVNLVIAVVTLVDLGRPLFFRQIRVGKDAERFTIVKFRNMTEERNEKGDLLPPEQRVTKWGKFVRRASLDELLNFWSIFKGDIPLRILKTRPEFSEESMGAFALPAKSSTNKKKVFSQATSCFASGLRMHRISWFNCKRVGSMEGQFLAKPVFRAVCA